MAISFQNALGAREHAVTLRAERASILSSNLANMNTPNYKARDIDFQAELQKRMAGTHTMNMHTTRQGHIQMNDLGGYTDRLYRTPHQPSIDGNTVEEHIEHAEFMKNSMEFQASFTFLNSAFKGLKKALSGQ